MLSCMTQILRTALPHLSLYCITLLYITIGVVLIYNIESMPTAKQLQESIDDAQNRLLDASENAQDYEEIVRLVDDFMAKIYELHLEYPESADHAALNKQPPLSPLRQRFHWLVSKIFFVVTTLVSVGYGKNAPRTDAGRVLCIVYGLAGIPLMIITLADMAKFSTDSISRLCMHLIRVRIRWTHQIQTWWRQKRNRRRSADDLEIDVEKVFDNVRIAGGDDEIAEFLWTHLENATIIEIPFALVYALLIGYVCFAAVLIAYLEQWSFMKSVYFVTISCLTIGFGDVVPSDGVNMLIITIIVFAGVVLASTCLDVLATYYLDRVHLVGRQAGKADPLEWLRLVQERRIRVMKMQAMRKLFETLTALNFINITAERAQELRELGYGPQDFKMMPFQAMALPSTYPPKSPDTEPPPLKDIHDREITIYTGIEDAPNPPLDFRCDHTTATSVLLRWTHPERNQALFPMRQWYTLTYASKSRVSHVLGEPEMIDFISGNEYLLTGLNSFTIYKFVLVTSTKYAYSKAVTAKEYTEPCTVPQNVRVTLITARSAVIIWDPPHKNKHYIPHYVVRYAEEPAPDHLLWSRLRVGVSNSCVLEHLRPDQTIMLVLCSETRLCARRAQPRIRYCVQAGVLRNTSARALLGKEIEN